MTQPDSGRPGGTTIFTGHSLLIALVLFLPVAAPSLFGWFNGLLAVPVFLLFQITGNVRQTTLQIRNGLLLAAVGSLLINKLPALVFALTMLPLGYSFYSSARQGDDPATTGGKGIITLALSWLLFWSIYGILAGANPYVNLLAMLDGSFAYILELYRNTSELPADVLYNLEQFIDSIREFLPRVLPGMLAGTVILTVWLNLAICNNLVHRLLPEKMNWPEYRFWQLPDKLVWLVIVAASLSLVGSGVVKNTGYCLIIVSVLLYFFQGMAVFIHFLERWNVPAFVRIVIYVILIIQSFGLLLLAMIGLADIWIDFRKMSHQEQK